MRMRREGGSCKLAPWMRGYVPGVASGSGLLGFLGLQGLYLYGCSCPDVPLLY